ncbi:hypothetical protein LX36DRAFT_716064 [Colletotrichum falcatum]|nr:hypothetical protein LX36DRAFT_716064 [Colletotrichum falcatum]
MYIPSFCQAATVGMAFYAMAAVAVPMNEPRDPASDALGIAKRTPGTAADADNVLLTTRGKEIGIKQDHYRCKRDKGGYRNCEYYDYDDYDYGRRGRGRGRGRGDGGGYGYGGYDRGDDRAVQNEAGKADGKNDKDLGKRGRGDGRGHDGGGRDGYDKGRRGGEDGYKGGDYGHEGGGDEGRGGPRRHEEHS